jgi:hypothetical protein
MTVELSQAAAADTTLTLNMTYAGSPGSIDIQYATRRTFEYCAAPIISVAAAAQVALTGLNKAGTYWIRGREVSSAGDRSDWGSPRAFTTTGAGSYPVIQIQVAPAQIIIPARPSRWYAGSAPVAGYSVDNMGRPTPAAAHRMGYQNGAAYFYVETDGSPIDTIALLETNLPEGARVRIIAADTAAAVVSGGSYASASQSFRVSAGISQRRGYHGIIRLPSPITNRFILIEISGETATGGVVHITHAVFGRARVATNYSDMTDTSFDLGTFNRSRDGSPDAVSGFRGRRVDFELPLMVESKHEALFADLAQRVGTTDPIFVIPNSKEGAYLHDRLLYGNLTTNRGTNSNARFTRSLSVESIIN